MFKLKPGSETITKTFRIPVDMSERLEQLAYKNNLSLNAVIIQCLQYALDNLMKREWRKSNPSKC